MLLVVKTNVRYALIRQVGGGPGPVETAFTGEAGPRGCTSLGADGTDPRA